MQGNGEPTTSLSVFFQNHPLVTELWSSFYYGATIKHYLQYRWERDQKNLITTWRLPLDQSLLSLPTELLHEIVRFCNAPSDLWTLMQTCSILRSVAKSFFWENTVWFIEPNSKLKTACPVAASQVQNLVIEELPPPPMTVTQYWASLQSAFPKLRAICLLKLITSNRQLFGQSDLPKAFTALEFLAAHPQGIDTNVKLELEIDVTPVLPVGGFLFQKLNLDGSWETVRLKKWLHWARIPPPTPPLKDFVWFLNQPGMEEAEEGLELMRLRIQDLEERHAGGIQDMIYGELYKHNVARERRRQLWYKMAGIWGQKGSEKRRRYEAAFLKQLAQDPFRKDEDIQESSLWKDLQTEMECFRFSEFPEYFCS